MKSATLIVFASLILVAPPTSAQKEEIPKNLSESVGGALGWAEKGFLDPPVGDNAYYQQLASEKCLAP